jgi:tRNA (guanosine-2'-O-)-methyltransferase
MENKLINYLSAFLLPARIERMDEVLSLRTRYITVVLEDFFQPQNASAVLRTCDCTGIHDVHVIENRNRFTVDTQVALGAGKWLNIKKYNKKNRNTTEALEVLKSQGYRIVATTPHKGDIAPEELDLAKGKVALVFGSEKTGISDTVVQMADEFVRIPMYGFTESYNVSVSAAIILYQLTRNLRKSGINGELSTEEKQIIKLEWMKGSIKKVELLLRNFNGQIEDL